MSVRTLSGAGRSLLMWADTHPPSEICIPLEVNPHFSWPAPSRLGPEILAQVFADYFIRFATMEKDRSAVSVRPGRNASSLGRHPSSERIGYFVLNGF